MELKVGIVGTNRGLDYINCFEVIEKSICNCKRQ